MLLDIFQGKVICDKKNHFDKLRTCQDVVDFCMWIEPNSGALSLHNYIRSELLSSNLTQRINARGSELHLLLQ